MPNMDGNRHLTFNSLSRDHRWRRSSTGAASSTFNSLSRDHLEALVQRLDADLIVAFNSLSRDHFAKNGAQALELLSPFNSLSRDHRPEVQHMGNHCWCCCDFQLPLSGSHHHRTDTCSTEQQYSFNSLSRDHITCGHRGSHATPDYI